MAAQGGSEERVSPSLRHRRSLAKTRALCVDDRKALLCSSDRLLLYWIDEDRVEPLGRIPWPGLLRRRLSHPLLRRILRSEFRSALQISDDTYLLVRPGVILQFDLSQRRWEVFRWLPHWRPFRLADVRGVDGFEDRVVYGEYGDNRGRGPMSVWGRGGEGPWRRLHTFEAGRVYHIHALVPDPARGCVWILTGDLGDEAGIWEARDDFRTVRPVVLGSQQVRSCWLFPIPDGLLYATDSHLERNSIRLLEGGPGGWNSRELHPLAGSCLQAVQMGRHIPFSTAWEPGLETGCRLFDFLDWRPGPGIVGTDCELVVGEPRSGFRQLVGWEVDRLPKRLFGYSTIELPAVRGAGDTLLLTGVGVRGRHHVTEVYEFAQEER